MELISFAEGIYEVCECTFMRVSPESLSYVIVERKYMYVFTHSKVLNECSASPDKTGSMITLTNIFLTFGKAIGVPVERQLEVCRGGLCQQNVNTRAQAQLQQQMQTSNHP